VSRADIAFTPAVRLRKLYETRKVSPLEVNPDRRPSWRGRIG
jgi:hypothetical protein